MKKFGQDNFAIQKNTKIKIKVITARCISAATCVVEASSTFDLDDDGIAYVKETTWDDALRIFQAAKSCPTKAIILEDMDGNVIWPK